MSATITTPEPAEQSSSAVSKAFIAWAKKVHPWIVCTLLLLGGIVAVGLTTAVSSGSGSAWIRAALQGFGFSLMTTAIVWIVQLLVVNRTQETFLTQLVGATVKTQSAEHLNKVQATVSGVVTTSSKYWASVIEVLHSSHVDYYPSHIFRESDEPSPEFNKILKEDLNRSTSYTFRGISGAYTAIRLKDGIHELERVRVILPDTRDIATLRRRYNYECNLGTTPPGTPAQQLHAQIRDRIAMAFVGLYNARERANFSVTFMAGHFDDRFEVLDNAAYVSSYKLDEAPTRLRFLKVLRFAKNSQTYRYLKSSAEAAGKSTEVKLHSALSSEDMGLRLEELGFATQGAGLETLEQLQAEFAAYRLKHAADLNTGN